MSKRSRTLASLLAISLLVATGCSGKGTKAPETTTSAPAAENKAPVTLSMWIMPNSAQSEPDMLATLKPFLDQHKNITVKVTVLDWGAAWPKITAAATSGDGPDILQLGTTWVPAIAAMDALEPLTNKVSEVGGKDAFWPASWNTTGIAGKPDVYALPWFVDARAAYYRTDAFEKAGVDPKEAFKDWDTFKKALQKVNGVEVGGKKMAAIGFPGKNDWNVAHNIFPWIWGAGGSDLNPDLKTVAINTDAALDGIMYYTGLAKEGLAPAAVLEKNSADVETMFTQGEFAVIFDTPALVRGFYTPTDKGGSAESPAAKHYAVAPIPAGPKGRFTFFGGSDLSIFKASKHKDEAWQVLKFLANKDTQVTYGKFSGMLPSVKSAEADMKAVDPNYAPFYEAMKFGRSYPAIPGWGPLETVLVKYMGNIWDITAGVSGTYSRDSIKKVLDEATKESNNLLKQ